MKRFFLFLLLGVFIFPVSAQDGPDYGFWSNLEDDKKVAFVQGYYTGLARGLKILGQEASRMRSQDKYWSPPFSHENSAKRISEFFTDPMPDYAEIARMINALYENNDNSHIKLETAIYIIMLHHGGKEKRANTILLREQKRVLKGK
ncbi:MAG TPA: hypothetical protein EYO34_03390 [Candidatus Marinimicrobia bacterium]|nr:hypothetical protein [Candidatus Neomarinimicrobiota bacterium]HIB94986.1 hypothetical protein [Candidatus Neomarinimicrobiota bacterium]HIN62867.1 hypothetical protein [Candidatus Neomarinimicrobiota bacterium]HIO36051.1 hypothetical protein [Candidatus Neomarinimicrobiota bacterium]